VTAAFSRASRRGGSRTRGSSTAGKAVARNGAAGSVENAAGSVEEQEPATYKEAMASKDAPKLWKTEAAAAASVKIWRIGRWKAEAAAAATAKTWTFRVEPSSRGSYGDITQV